MTTGHEGRGSLGYAGDRTILAVALVIAGAIVAMVAFSFLAADRVDRASRARWSQLMSESLERRANGLERDLASFAHWDESVLRTAYFLDAEWVHENFGHWLYQSQGHDRSYIILDGRVAYASIDGASVAPEQAAFDPQAILPLVRSVQETFRKQAEAAAEHPVNGKGGNEPPPVFEAAYMRVEGRPALVGAISITPDYGRVVSPERLPPIAVTVVFLANSFLRGIVAELHVNDPEIVSEPPLENRLAVRVPFRDPNTAPAWLSWVPENQGAALLRALLPALLGTAALLLAAAAITLWYARRATRELAASEALTSRLAYVDSLSGLANRAMLMRALDERLARISSEDRLALFFLDLDGFKDINDTLGHHIGDQLLAEIGARLKELALPGMLASRFGGDEFVLIASASGDNHEIEAMGALIIEAVRRPATVAGHVLSVSGSIGATVAPDHGVEASQLIRLADIAVYRAKAEGRGSIRFFEPRMEREVVRRRDLELDLRRALKDGEFTVYFQPQFSVDGEAVVGFEALVRWLHHTQGLISPGEFIPVAEQTGLVTELDLWVLRHACTQARGWGDVKIAVNLSPVDFRSERLAADVCAILKETDFPPERLEIEITENLLIGNHSEAFAALSAFRQSGIRIALDDFGSGYSSLGYIRRFRVDTIKIDRSFTQNIGRSDDAAAIIDCVVRLARALAITVTAEGVETREQLRYLQSVGCHQVQGFFLASPVAVANIGRFLERVRPASRVAGRRGAL